MVSLGGRLILALSLLWTLPSLAELGPGEPKYCAPEHFLTSEIQVLRAGIPDRLHAFRLGKTVLAGMAIGLSEASDVQRIAELYSSKPAPGFCTWYLNNGNEAAEKLFHHIYMDSPLQLTPDAAAARYRELLELSFLDRETGFVSCLENQNYLAFGCNGQSHRGPAVFGMLLTFSGCSAENAEQIVNALWGLNGVDVRVRLAILREGFELGSQNPELRGRLQSLFD